MKHALLILLTLLWLGTSASAVERFVRPLGGTTTQCTGLANVDYDGSGTGEACAYSSVDDVTAAAACGDNLNLLLGGTWDGTFILPNKSCSVSTPITLRSSAHASLPAGRVGPSDAANMPRLRTLGSGGLPTIRAAANADWWIIDGIEITDNAGINAVTYPLADLGFNPGVDNIVVQRCWIHQKETGTDYSRSAQYAVGWYGNNLTLKWNYITMIGYDPTVTNFGATYPSQTIALSVGIPAAGVSDILVEDNFIGVWYSAFFFGGQDSDAAHSATLASGATMTQATLSSTTNLTPGTIMLLSVTIQGTLGTFVPYDGNGQRAPFTRISGAVLTDADVGTAPTIGTAMKVQGQPFSLNVDLVDTINSTDYTVRESTSWSTPGPSGPYDWELLTTVMVDTVNTGTGVVTYHPYGVNGLTQNPSTPGRAQWSADDEGLVNDAVIRQNTIYIDPAFAEFARTTSNQGPKGYFEIKNSNRMIIEGNRFGGWPAVIAWTGSNQNGGSPWTTIDDTIFRNNWVEPLNNATTQTHMREIFIMTVNQYRTARRGTDFQVSNNVFIGGSGLCNFCNTDNPSYIHNTFINNTYGSYQSIIGEQAPPIDTTGFTFRDNILPFNRYGLWCESGGGIAGCWNPATISKNVVVDDWPRGPSEVYTTVWGAGGILSPIASSFTAVGFTDISTLVLSLAASSPYKGLGTSNTDPGVDWTALQAALTGANNPPTAGAGLDQNLGPVTSTTLMGTASDPDGDTPLTYSWVRTSGPNTPTIVSSTALTTLITGMTTGTYIFTLTVTDPDGASSSDMVSVTIAASGAVTTCRWQTSPPCVP